MVEHDVLSCINTVQNMLLRIFFQDPVRTVKIFKIHMSRIPLSYPFGF